MPMIPIPVVSHLNPVAPLNSSLSPTSMGFYKILGPFTHCQLVLSWKPKFIKHSNQVKRTCYAQSKQVRQDLRLGLEEFSCLEYNIFAEESVSVRGKTRVGL